MQAKQINNKVTVLRFVEGGVLALALALALAGVVKPTSTTAEGGIL
ncbi:MAG: hypothetical protein JHC22_05465 [Thermoproteus sp.]|jgi:hypothetical protein|nr:hypothetical protein [Thermoproteus sp.]